MMYQKILSVVLSCALTLSLVPVSALGDELEGSEGVDAASVEEAAEPQEEGVAEEVVETACEDVSEETAEAAGDASDGETYITEDAVDESAVSDSDDYSLEPMAIPTGDADAPELDLASLEISRSEARAGDEVRFACSLSDASGVSSASLSVKNVGTGKTASITLRPSGGVWSGALQVGDATVPGEWVPYYLYVFDTESNSARYVDSRSSLSLGTTYKVDLSAWDFVVVPVECSLITYKDGCGGELFADKQIIEEDGMPTPAFDGEPMRDGYIFNGWSPEIAETVAGDAIYTATWKVDDRPSYTVTFTDGCNGKVFADYVYALPEGDAAYDPGLNTYREGYVFAGWDPDLSSPVSSDLTYTAIWTPSADYVVAIDEGPIEIVVNNPRITTNFNGITWKTTNVDLGSVSGIKTLYISDNGITTSTDFYPQQEGFATLYATDSNGTRTIGSCTVLVTPSNKIDITTLDASLDKTTFKYDVNGVWPVVTVKDGDKVLVEGTDYYTVTEGNFAVGAGTVYVYGQGNYRECAELPFTVEATDINDVECSGVEDQTYSGEELKPALALAQQGTNLSEGTDYELSYAGNVNAGTATVTVKGVGGFTGTRELTFEILPKEVTVSAAAASKTYGETDPELSAEVEGLVGSDKVAYELTREPGEDVGNYAISATGDARQGNYLVSFEGAELTINRKSVSVAPVASGKTYGEADPELTANVTGLVGSDEIVYTLSRPAGEDAGAYVITAEGASEQGNYQVSFGEANFVIEPVDLSQASVSDVPDQTFSGKAQTPTPTVKLGSKTLAKDVDYTLSYDKNTSAGTATVTVKGKGNYKGTVKKTFTIAPADISKATVGKVADQTWTGKALTPKPAVKIGSTTLKEGTDYTLSYKNNTAVGTATVTITGKGNYTETTTTTFKIVAKPHVAYRTHVQNVGWQSYVRDGAMSGTSGRSLRLEGINIKLEGAPYSGSIEYRTHVQNIGWQPYVKDGAMAGTSGRSLRLEGIQIRLTGEMAKHYDIYYRVHCQNLGWMGWAKNGAMSGSAGFSYRLEGIEIRLVEKGGAAPGPTSNAFATKTGSQSGVPDAESLVLYRTHVQNVGWQPFMRDGESAGTSGRSLRLEGIEVKLPNAPYAGGIRYATHVQNIGWQGWRSDGAMSGTSGRSLRLEAIRIELTGEMAKRYDVWYRVHAQNFGWMGWARNGADAGTAGYSYRLEAIQIVLVPKGGTAPGSTANAFRQK